MGKAMGSIRDQQLNVNKTKIMMPVASLRVF